MTFAAEKLSDFAANLQIGDVPSDVIDYTKMLIADTIAASILGGRMPWSKAVREVALASKPQGKSSIIGVNDSTSANAAAFVNGAYAHANDFDDFYAFGPCHPSMAVWVALPVAEEVRAKGADVVTSVIIGYEISGRLAEACFSGSKKEKALVERGLHAQPAFGVVAAAAQAARLMGLSSSTSASAMGIAGSYAGGLMQFMAEPADTKRFHFGKAAGDGITSAQLAAHGFRGPKSVLEGRKGLLNAIAGEWVESKLTDGLGTKYAVMSSFLKPVPTMGGNFGNYEAMCLIMEKNKLTADNIKSITAEIRSQFEGYSLGFGEKSIEEHYSPPDRYTAEMSLPYLIGLVAVYGRNLKPVHFDYAERTNKSLLDVVRRVKIEFAKDIDEISRLDGYAMGRVTVHTNKGETFTEAVRIPSGDPRKPRSWQQIRTKFEDCVEGASDNATVGEFLDTIGTLEKVPNVERLGALLRKSQTTPWPGEPK